MYFSQKVRNMLVLLFQCVFESLIFIEKFSPLLEFEPWTSPLPSRYATNRAILAWLLTNSKAVWYICADTEIKLKNTYSGNLCFFWLGVFKFCFQIQFFRRNFGRCKMSKIPDFFHQYLTLGFFFTRSSSFF